MTVLPELNLNRHPKDCKNCSLVDAEHFVVDKDSFLLHTENSICTNEDVTKQIQNIVGENFKIIYAIPCNKEIVFFVLYNNRINLIRYNEDLNISKDCGEIEYNGGNFTGTFTYNKNNLIISFSEFGDNLNVPLKVINLGEINKSNKIRNTLFHPICPEVRIPECITEYTNGSARKGWYYIFIRYKISSNNYTQWFNTGKSVFVDSYSKDYFEDYYISGQAFGIKDGAGSGILTGENQEKNRVDINISNEFDVANITFITSFINLDNSYNEYQIGYINVRKDTTKCYITNDININTKEVIFNSKIINEDSVINLITSYYNYYNVKTIDNYNNILYIANYNEYFNEVDVNNINIELNGYTKKSNNNEVNIVKTGTSGRPGLPNKILGVLPEKTIYNNSLTTFQINYYLDGNKKYIKLNDFIWGFRLFFDYTTNNPSFQQNYYKTFPYGGYSINDRSIIKINNHHIVYEAYASNIRYYFEFDDFDKSKSYYRITDLSGYEFIIDDLKEFDIYNIFELSHIDNRVVSFIHDEDGRLCHSRPMSIIHLFKFNYKNYEIDKTTATILDSNCIMPDEYYNFYVHFVNKYGEATQGIELNKFNIFINEYLSKEVNKIGNTLIHTNENCIGITCNISRLPTGYSGYFISYEKFEKHNIHKGFIDKDAKFISMHLNVELAENINFNFNKLKVDGINTLIKINNKTLYLADNYNNIAYPTNIKLDVDTNYITTLDTLYKSKGIVKAYLINDNIDNLYNSVNKILIQCTKVCYDIQTNIDININNAFKSTVSYFKHTETQRYYDYERGSIQPTSNERIFFNTAINFYSPLGSYGYCFDVYDYNTYDDYLNVPTESYQFLNNPKVIFFPIIGLTETDNGKKGFEIGCITEMKNTIDLFQQKNPAVYEMCPKVYSNYIEENNNLSKFPKTIRRSNVIADESDHIGWRFFETDNYKNIVENKGNIIKLTSISNIIFAHTEHSLFQFKADNALNANDNSNISIAANDIWDIPYQEVFTSELGFAGINNINQAIVGQFGYIFYEADKRRFFRYDNNSIKQIDININNYIRKLDCENIIFVDDVDRDRLIITLYNDNIKETLSYNYKYNIFVSRHKYNHCIGYNTKNKIYLIDYNIITGVNFDNTIKHFAQNHFNDYIQDNVCSLSIIVNTDYEINKMLEFIQYRITKLDKSDNLIIPRYNSNGFYYPGELLEIFSEECYTGKMNIYTDKDNSRLNSVREPHKPYRELGVWNFNYIRNDITSLPVKKSDVLTRFYGNWFVLKFTFTPETTKNCCIEIEALNYNVSKNLT